MTTTYRYKKNSNIDAYGTSDNVIHAKFGDLRKAYNFTEEFRDKYPRFTEEYDKYWLGEDSVFENAMQLLNYIEQHDIPVKLYSNFVDEEFEDVQACKEWLMNESVSVKAYENMDEATL